MAENLNRVSSIEQNIFSLTCFKSYDVRGELEVNFNTTIAYKIGRAIAQHFRAKAIAVGRDARQSSPELAKSVISGITDYGADVLDLGLSGTEEMYSAVTKFNTCAGIEITASHNPINFNGLKFVKSGSKPLHSEKDFKVIKKIAELSKWEINESVGKVTDVSILARKAYVDKVLSFINVNKLKSYKIIVNSGNGAAGPTFDAIAKELQNRKVPIKFIRINHDPDYTFPNGIPNPLLIENHSPMRDMILRHQADFGIAFDGDFDRCFFFDEKGEFVSGEYIVGILAGLFLDKEPGATIVHDPRVIWNIQDFVEAKGGFCEVSKTGHTFIKRTMRQHKAVYGGELSAHHYFRDFSYCDSGMIPWLLICEKLSTSDQSLREMISLRQTKFVSSGELNFYIKDGQAAIADVIAYYQNEFKTKSNIDGVSLCFEHWRLNLRLSNTEPLVRLNVETRNDIRFLEDKVREITSLLKNFIDNG